MKKILKTINNKGVLLVILLVGLILISSFSIIQIKNISNDNTNLNEDIVLPKISSDEILIKTPENKTYYNPMSGYYPATYSFDNDKNGENPTGFANILESAGTVNVIDELAGHKKVVEIHRTGSGAVTGIFDSMAPLYTTLIPNGTIEFWVRISDVNNRFQFDLGGNDETWPLTFAALFTDGGKWYYDDYTTPTQVPNVDSPQNNVWHHITFHFRCNGAPAYQGLGESKAKVIIDGKDSGELDVRASKTAITRQSWYTWDQSVNYYVYVDAIGCSWNKSYNLGDNKKEGLLLSYENSTNLDWIGYSLDGSANKTILGNTTIPMPLNGQHTIQFFGKDNLNNIYSSEIKFFKIDNWNSISLLPAHTKVIIDLRSQFELYIEVQTNNSGYIEISRYISDYLEVENSLGSIKPYYFYSFETYDNNFAKNDTIIESILIRFYYNSTTINDTSEIYLLHYLYDINNDIMIWEAEVIKLNMDMKYVEINITKLSYFCLCEINIIHTIIIDGDDDGNNSSSKEILVFSTPAMILIIILCTIGIAIPTAYLYKTKIKQKNKKKLLEKNIQQSGKKSKKSTSLYMEPKYEFQEKKEENLEKTDLGEFSSENIVNNIDLTKIITENNLLNTLLDSNDVNITMLPENFMKIIDKLKWDENEKELFIKEMLALTPIERTYFLNDMIKASEFKNSNDQDDDEVSDY